MLKQKTIISFILALIMALNSAYIPVFSSESSDMQDPAIGYSSSENGKETAALSDLIAASEKEPVASQPSADKITVAVRIEANNITVMPREEAFVNETKYDLTEYGFSKNPSYPSAMHALINALESMGLDSKDLSVLRQSGGWLTSICGLGDDYEGFWMYTVNGRVVNDSLLECALEPGDSLLFFFVADWEKDFYAYFDTEKATVQSGDVLSLTLQGESIYKLAFYGETGLEAIEGAEILVSDDGTNSADNPTSVFTDKEGRANIVFDTPGVYLVSAVGTTTSVTRPYCEVTVTPGKIAMTDQDFADEVKHTLTLGDTTKVTENITLPTNWGAEADIVWSTSNSAVITEKGIVTRPVSGASDVTAVLTATIQYGSARALKSFNIIVLALPEDPGMAVTPESLLRNSQVYFLSLPNRRLSSFWEIGAVHGAWGSLNGYSLPDYSRKPESNSPADYAGQILGMLAAGGKNFTDCETDLPGALAKMQNADGVFDTQVNQHIWAVIAMGKTGAFYNRDGAVNAILSMQSADGSIEGFDMTGMALVALSANRDIPGVASAISKAVDYLKSTQTQSGSLAGGWGDNSNTIATVISGLIAAGEDVTSWPHNPVETLAKFQHADGGFVYRLGHEISNVGATSQSVIALGDVIRGNSFWLSMSGAIPEPPTEFLNKTDLRNRLRYAEGFDADRYTIASYQKLVDATERAKAVLNDAGVAQTQLDEAFNALNFAIDALVEKDTSKIRVWLTVTGDNSRGTILDMYSEIGKNSSVFDLLKKSFDDAKIRFTYNGNGASVYIKSIDGLAEKTNGANSGWLYTVNGNIPDESCGAVRLKEDDEIHVFFVYDYTEATSYSSGINDGGSDVPDYVVAPGTRDIFDNKTPSAGSPDSKTPMVSLERIKRDVAAIKASYQLSVSPSEWEAIGLLVSGGKLSAEKTKEMKTAVKQSGGSFRTATDAARLALLLQISGQDITNIEGVDLLKSICNNKAMGKQGLNGYIFSLLAMSNANQIPSGTAMTIKSVSNTILAAQNNDGGFPLAIEGASNLDITAMAITALAPYKNDAKIQAAINKAANYLVARQQGDGTFLSGQVKSSETISQIIIALCSAGIDPDNDRFTKNGKSLMDVLYGFKCNDRTFTHTTGGQPSNIATEQAMLAMQSYIRYFEGKSPIYTYKTLVASPAAKAVA